jgi:hypothetical protein
MNWDNYPTTDQDYDLHLVRLEDPPGPNPLGWYLVTSSTNWQNGTPPEESIYYVNDEVDGIYGLIVEQYSATSNADFTLFSLGYGFGYHTTASSVTDPASTTDVVTVGAIDRTEYDTGPQQYFSSQGPTTDGRIKPDIMAPDNCISYAYGYWNGTSLASPHTAGICAVIKSSSPGYSNAQIKNYLYSDAAIDMGDAGKDNIYGWGRIGLSDSPLPVELSLFTASTHKNGIALEWATTSELNNMYWVLEKKEIFPNTTDTEAIFTELARIDGQGSASEQSSYRYFDSEVKPNGSYRYRLADISYSGKKTYHTSISATYEVPATYHLDQNFPNPFNPYTTIAFDLPKKSDVTLEIFNIRGSRIGTLVNESLPAGRYKYYWNSNGMASGVYIYRIQAEQFTKQMKMMLIK